MSEIFIGDGTFAKKDECQVFIYDNFHLLKDINGNYKAEAINHELYLFKYCDEYNNLERILELNDSEELENYILFLIIKNLYFDEFIEVLIHIEQRGFDEGYKKAQKHIRKSLGIDI